jgi:hypothetical protein
VFSRCSGPAISIPRSTRIIANTGGAQDHSATLVSERKMRYAWPFWHCRPDELFSDEGFSSHCDRSYPSSAIRQNSLPYAIHCHSVNRRQPAHPAGFTEDRRTHHLAVTPHSVAAPLECERWDAIQIISFHSGPGVWPTHAIHIFPTTTPPCAVSIHTTVSEDSSITSH